MAQPLPVGGLGPSMPRLADPELRSRVTGYLATAPRVGAGQRSDGVWVWPESLADAVRTRGVGPEQALLDHLTARGLLLADDTAADGGAAADIGAAADLGAAEVGVAPPGGAIGAGHLPPRAAAARAYHYLAAFLGPAGRLRVIRRVDGPGDSGEESLGPYGWEPSDVTRAGRGPAPVRCEPLNEPAASKLIDEFCGSWHERRHREALESDPDSGPVRLARIFDSESPTGAAWFSANRLRIVEPARRDRIASYLTRGRLVVRVIGGVADPVGGAGGGAVPLSWRTDGVWVWQEALAYYLLGRGVAPELALLCHIEERGYALPAPIADEALAAARAAVAHPAPLRLVRPDQSYFAPRLPTGPAALVRITGGDSYAAQLLGPDLRWRWFDQPWSDPPAFAATFAEVSEAEAVAIIDTGWAQRSASTALKHLPFATAGLADAHSSRSPEPTCASPQPSEPSSTDPTR